MSKAIIWTGAAVLTAMVALGALFWVFPSLVLSRLQKDIATVSGRTLGVDGGAHLEIAPQLALRLDGVALSNPAGIEGNVIRAEAARFALSFADVFGSGGNHGTVTLVGPQFSFLIDAQGRANWLLPDGMPASRLVLEDAEIAYLDVRSGQAYKFGGLSAVADVSATREFTLDGTAMLNGAFAKVKAYLKAPNRIPADGSPADLGLDAPALKASFSGRLAAASSLGLAGPISLSGKDLRGALSWAGVALGGSQAFKAFTVSGGLDSEGGASIVNNAEMSLDGITAKGRVGLDLAPATPVILADLTMDRLDLDKYVGPPVKEGWNMHPLGLEKLKGVDAQFSLTATDMAIRGTATGPAKLSGKLADGTLILDLEADRLKFELTLNADGALLDFQTTRTIFPWLEGTSMVSMKVSGKGNSEASIISTLRGDAEIRTAPGKLRDIDILATATKSAVGVQEGWPRNGTTSIDTGVAKFTIADGIANASEVNLAGPALKLTGKGEIDLLREAIDFRFEPRTIRGATARAVLPVAVAVKGLWNLPRIYPDVPDILVDPEAAYQALRAMDMPAPESN